MHLHHYVKITKLKYSNQSPPIRLPHPQAGPFNRNFSTYPLSPNCIFRYVFQNSTEVILSLFARYLSSTTALLFLYSDKSFLHRLFSFQYLSLFSTRIHPVFKCGFTARSFLCQKLCSGE